MSEAQQNWRKSSYCKTDDCVEVCKVGGTVLLRNSRDPQGPILKFSTEDWATFIEETRNDAKRLPRGGLPTNVLEWVKAMVIALSSIAAIASSLRMFSD